MSKARSAPARSAASARSALLALCAIFFLFFSSLGCGGSTPPPPVPSPVPPASPLPAPSASASSPASSSSSAASPTSTPTFFCLARIPFLNPTSVVRHHQALVDRLAARVGRTRGVMVTAPDYDGVLRLLLDRKVDAAWLGTVAYARARLQGEAIEPLVAPVRKGRHSYRGAIICRRSAPLATVADLKGKRVAFVEPNSASGYLYPRVLLTRQGVRVPDDFVTGEHGQVDFLGKHDAVVLAVFLGRYDAGAVYEGAVEETFRDHPERASDLKVLALTDRMYNEPICVLSDLSEAEKRRIKDAFLAEKIDDPLESAVMSDLEGFATVTSAEYEGILGGLRSAPRTPPATSSLPAGS